MDYSPSIAPAKETDDQADQEENPSEAEENEDEERVLFGAPVRLAEEHRPMGVKTLTVAVPLPSNSAKDD